ncbi:MAG TPA: hemolysin family protein [Candidatus Dormibacteraeota bacterium]|nr:hemolysin family protein [Candidatus Dormibacteraeota bacterium]
MTIGDLVLVVLLFLTLVLAWLAAAAETALTSVSRIRLRRLVEQGDPRARTIERLHREPNDYLTAILTTNTTAIIVSATAAGLIANNHGWGAIVPQLVVSLVDAVVVLVFCEITAKSVALANSLAFALAFAPAVSVVTSVLRPLLRGMSSVARLFVNTARAKGPFLTEEELKMMVTVGEEEGIIEEQEREMIHGIIEIGDMTVREVMVPRIDIVAVEVRRPVQEIVDLILKHGHTRIPVYEDNIDNIIGIAYAKDLLRYRAERRDGDLRSVIRPALKVPENKNLADLLRDLREKRVHMAIVVDEFGQTAGLVTIEDVIEEIIGPIRDEYDTLEEEEIQFLAPNEAVLEARLSLDDARDLLGLPLEAEDVDSVGGFIYSRVGTIPRAGEVIDLGNGAVMTVVNVRGQRIGKVRVRATEPFPGAVARDEAGVGDVDSSRRLGAVRDEAPVDPPSALSQ